MRFTFYGNGDVAWVEAENAAEQSVLSIARRLEAEQPQWDLMRLITEAHARAGDGREMLH